MPDSSSPITFVVMAREPIAGRVKTRLSGPGGVDPAVAAVVAEAMLACLVDRLAARGPVVLAGTPDGRAGAMAAALGRPEIACVDQGGGDLGDRLDRVWRLVGVDRPVAFFGMDSPDVPATALDDLAGTLAGADAAIGPTPDGGYWTLAATRHRPALLRDIDWGSDRVYHQTCQRGADHGLTIRPLARWPDVDTPADLADLRRRLARDHASTPETPDTALMRLAARLDRLLGPAAV